MSRILVVDDERSMRELLEHVLRREGHEVLVAENGRSAVALLEREPVDLLISDIKMPDMSGVHVLRAAKELDPDLPGIMVTAYASTTTAIDAFRMGAYDYLTKPFDIEELKLKLRNALEKRELKKENAALRRNVQDQTTVIGSGDKIRAVLKLIRTVAPTNSTVLITGESGTGKDLIAREIHANSLRRGPFVALNCGALPETLLESELFGHMRGAFTGAASNKKGLVEVAEKGTIFLDEISEMSPMMQVKLLRVLQERKFRRVGGLEEIGADIRVIAATNRDLARLVAGGKFREDLFYRINVISIQLPPLRERVEDIPMLANHFRDKYARQMSRPVRAISPDTYALLAQYEWPGNIRELENAIERAVALEGGDQITPESLPDHLRDGAFRGDASPDPMLLPSTGFDLEQHVQEVERNYIAEALRRANGVQVKAAEMLGMSFRSFRYYAKKYNLK